MLPEPRHAGEVQQRGERHQSAGSATPSTGRRDSRRSARLRSGVTRCISSSSRSGSSGTADAAGWRCRGSPGSAAVRASRAASGCGPIAGTAGTGRRRARRPCPSRGRLSRQCRLPRRPCRHLPGLQPFYREIPQRRGKSNTCRMTRGPSARSSDAAHSAVLRRSRSPSPSSAPRRPRGEARRRHRLRLHLGPALRRGRRRLHPRRRFARHGRAGAPDVACRSRSTR